MAIIPKLALIPSAYKAGKIYSVLPTDGVGDFNFSRGSASTRINKDGLIETVASGVPRLNYPLVDGVVNGCPSHLLEPTRSNLATNNNDVSNASWTKTQVSAFSNDTISPDGTLNASKIVSNTISSSHYFDQQFNIGANDVTISAYVKNIDANFIQVTNAANANAYANFDIQNGTVGTNGSAMPNPKIEKLPNDWYRISVAVDNTGFPITYMRFWFISSASAPFNQNWSPTSAISFNFWGGQCELGSFETSVISTTTSAVTRSAENANGAGDASTFNDSEGVLYAEISKNKGNQYSLISLYKSSVSDTYLYLGYLNNTTTIKANITIGGAVVFDKLIVIADTSVNIKVAIKYSSGNHSLFINGLEVGSSTDTTTFADGDLNEIDFGLINNSLFDFYGKVKQIQYFDTALTDAELIALTTI